jgi:hypothetical protein
MALMFRIRSLLFSLAVLAASWLPAFAGTSSVPNLTTFRLNSYGGTVWLQGYVKPGDGGEGYFLPNGKSCTDNGTTVIQDASGTCWDRQNFGSNTGTYPTVYRDMTDVTCASDAACAQLGSILLNVVDFGGVTASHHYTWNPNFTGTPDGTYCFTRPGATKAFCMTDPNVPGIASIAALEALPSPSVIATVWVNGTQGGWFVWTSGTCTTDGGTIFCDPNDTSGYWQRQVQGPLTFAMFGAAGTGIVDDTSSIVAAVAAGIALGCSEIDGSPGKTYLVSGEILLQPTSNGCLTIDLKNSTLSISPSTWTTGSSPTFFALFTTRHVTSTPVNNSTQFGNGDCFTTGCSFQKILIENGTINLNRDGTVLTSTQMSASSFNAVRFEDCLSCQVKNVKIHDLETSTNFQQTATINCSYSISCNIDGIISDNSDLFFEYDASYPRISHIYAATASGTVIETQYGIGPNVSDVYVGATWASVSSVGLNSISSHIDNLTVASSAVSGLTFGDYTSSYFDASNSTAENIHILAGAPSPLGYEGILIQSGSHIRLNDIYINGLNVDGAGAYQSILHGGVVIASNSISNATDISITKTYVNTATAGVVLNTGSHITISDDRFKNVNVGVYNSDTVDNIEGILNNITVDTAYAAVNWQSGPLSISNSYFNSISNVGYGFVIGRGNVSISTSIFNECEQINLFNINAFRFFGNDITKATALTYPIAIDNSAGGTESGLTTTVFGNSYPSGTTNLVHASSITGEANPWNFNSNYPAQ